MIYRVALWYKIEDGAEPQAFFKVSDILHTCKTQFTLYIVGEYQGKAMTIWPEVHIGHRVELSLAQHIGNTVKLKPYIAVFYWPAKSKMNFLLSSIELPEQDAKGSRQQWFQLVIQPAAPTELPPLGTKQFLAKHHRYGMIGVNIIASVIAGEDRSSNLNCISPLRL